MKTGLKWKLIGPYYGSKILLHGFVSRGIVFSSKPLTDSLPPSFLYHRDLLELGLLTLYKLLKLRKQDRHQSEKKTSHVTSAIFCPSKTCKVGPPSQSLGNYYYITSTTYDSLSFQSTSSTLLRFLCKSEIQT